MLFNSFEFLLFFPAVTLLFFLFKHRYRWLILLMASCLFYMFFKPVYILILLFTIIIDYYAAIFIEKRQGFARKNFLVISIIANVGILAFFKYFNFFNDNFTGLASIVGIRNPIPHLAILLPIGLSFHTFQAMSYTIEVYRQRQKAERHLGVYALYVMFYPQLVAGPIERPQNVLHQFHEEKFFTYQNAVVGLRLMLWGFFKKVLIADNLAIIVNTIYNRPCDYDSFSVAIACVLFSFQIYCDFSGYSDIAIGSARVMGFNLMQNFHTPYFSASISEFWTRWHISLSTWFRDYVYIPLGGNRNGVARQCYNLLVVFMVSGLWHGAKWTFIIWGLLHGFFIVTSLLFGRIIIVKNTFVKNFIRPFRTAIVFLMVTFAWIFFRAQDVEQAFTIIKQIFSNNIEGTIRYSLAGFPAPDSNRHFIVALFAILFMLLIEFIQRRRAFSYFFDDKPLFFRWTFYFLLVAALSLFGVFHAGTEFIYFQF